MQIAVLISLCLILLTHIYIKRRPRFSGFSCLRAGGKIKEHIVRVEKIKCGLMLRKLSNEIKIFNRMRLVMPCRRGVPVLYSQFLGRLVLQPSWVYKGDDGICRFLYVCAAVNYFNNTTDGLVKRQLVKNCLYVFGQKDIFKKRVRVRVRIASSCLLAMTRQTRFKYLARQFVFAEKRQDRPSYTIYDGIKHYADKVLPVQCFETAERFSHFTGSDKFKYSLSHTSDTFYAVGEGKAVGVYVPDKVTFGSSICEKGDELKVYATSEGGKYYVITAKTKSEVTAIVGDIKRRRGKLDYLLTSKEASEVMHIERQYERAWSSRFVKGDGLKDKWAAAGKYVPTLFLPTLVYQIEQPEDFFAVVDNFKCFKRIGNTGNHLNIIFLYSSMNDEVREIMKNFADRDEAQSLVKAGVFLFFVDRVKAESKAVNYFSLMSNIRLGIATSPTAPRNDAEVVTHISNSFPITHTVYIRNALKRPTKANACIPLDVGGELEGLPFGIPAVCRRVGANLHVKSLKSGRSSVYKLPMGSVVTDEFGRTIGGGETMCETVFVRCDVRLAKFEEKVLKIIKSSKVEKLLAGDDKLA